MILRKLMTLSLAIAAVLLIGQNSASAQDMGYRFGVGLDYSNYGHSRRFLLNNGFAPFGDFTRNADFTWRNEVPYFALNPPVYYSEQIVRRPYGISPFAAPPGIIPTEMIVAPEPVIIENPHFQPPGAENLPAKPKAPKKKPQPKKDNKNQKTSDTSQVNVLIKNDFFLEQNAAALVIK